MWHWGSLFWPALSDKPIIVLHGFVVRTVCGYKYLLLGGVFFSVDFIAISLNCETASEPTLLWQRKPGLRLTCCRSNFVSKTQHQICRNICILFRSIHLKSCFKTSQKTWEESRVKRRQRNVNVMYPQTRYVLDNMGLKRCIFLNFPTISFLYQGKCHVPANWIHSWSDYKFSEQTFMRIFSGQFIPYLKQNRSH